MSFLIMCHHMKFLTYMFPKTGRVSIPALQTEFQSCSHIAELGLNPTEIDCRLHAFLSRAAPEVEGTETFWHAS